MYLPRGRKWDQLETRTDDWGGHADQKLWRDLFFLRWFRTEASSKLVNLEAALLAFPNLMNEVD